MLKAVVFAGGGTGGHVYMAVALAKGLIRRNPKTRILFVGTKHGLETRILPSLGLALETITIGALKSVSPARVLTTLLQLPASVLHSGRILHRFGPSVIVGLGGYASGPVVVAGKLARVPCLLVEPNVRPGLTNRLLGPWSNRVAVAFAQTKIWFGKKACATGTPIRPEFYQCGTRKKGGGRLQVLVFGGSQGSRAINDLICESLEFLPPNRISIVHQTGSLDYQRVKRCYQRAGIRVQIKEFIEDMPTCFHRSDVIVSRAGACTLAEITAAGKPSLLIPLPRASDDHQRRNASALVACRAAVVLEQKKASGRKVAQILVELERDRKRLNEIGQAARTLAQPQATEKIIGLMEEMDTRSRR